MNRPVGREATPETRTLGVWIRSTLMGALDAHGPRRMELVEDGPPGPPDGRPTKKIVVHYLHAGTVQGRRVHAWSFDGEVRLDGLESMVFMGELAQDEQSGAFLSFELKTAVC